MDTKKCEHIVIGGLEFKVLYDRLVSRLSDEEYERLKSDIAENSVLVPVAVDEAKGVIDGVSRLRAASELGLKSVPCHIHYGLGHKDKRDLAIKLNALRRHWSAEERLKLAITLRKDKYSFRRIAQVLNLSHETVRRHLLDLGGKEGFPETTIGQDGIERPAKSRKPSCVVVKDKKDANNAFRALSGLKGKLKAFDTIDAKSLSRKIKCHHINQADTDNCSDSQLGKATLLLGDFREKGREITDESVDMVFTDPPYAEDALPLWDALGEFAHRILKPGGILLSYAGNLYIPQIHQMLGRHLQYFWTFAVRHTGGNTFVRTLKIQQAYKPILGYFKPPFTQSWEPFCDMVSGGRSKENHRWEQPVEEAQYFLRALCPPNGTVCEPMMGSGSTVIAGIGLSMSCYGIEIDTTSFAKAKERIEKINRTLTKKAA